MAEDLNVQRKHYIAPFKQEIIQARGQTNIRKTCHKQLPNVYSYPFSSPIKHTVNAFNFKMLVVWLKLLLL